MIVVPPRMMFPLVGLLALWGCSKAAPVPQVQTVMLDNVQIVERDAGTITDSPFDYDFLVGGADLKEIVSVSANCGCTGLSLHNGDVFDYSTPFRVTVQLHNSQFGKGRQDFFIKFSDGTAIEGRLAYEYAPPPFVTPEELRFFEDVNEKETIFCFPNEAAVAIQEVIHPIGITWKREHEKERRNEVCLAFEIDRTLFEGDPTGTIEVLTTSRNKPRFSLSYLVLRP